MASGGQKAATGAASGAVAGASFGPWGALIGGVVGGAAGYLQGDDPTAPGYVPPGAPMTPGGTNSQYGGMTIDPLTGRVTYTNNQSDGYQTASQYQNQLMRQMMIGGNGAQIGLADQIKQQQQLIDSLGKKKPGTAANGQVMPNMEDYFGPEWAEMVKFDKDGKIDKTALDAAMANPNGVERGGKLWNAFMGNTGGNYGSSNKDISFAKWLQDSYRKNVTPQLEKLQKDTRLLESNAEVTDDGLAAAQRKLESLLQIQQSGASTEKEFANNPLMNYLNQRNQTAGPNGYMDKFADPNTKTMQDTFEKYLGKADENVDSTGFKIAGAEDPGMPDVARTNAMLMASRGSSGGERMTPLGEYQTGGAGAFVNNLNRVAEKNYASQAGLQAQLSARRGLMGGSSDINRLAMEQALEDNRSSNAAQGYGMERADQDSWFQKKFAVDAHNSDVAKNKASTLASLLQQTNGNEFAAKQLYNQMQQQAWTNNEGLKQTNFGNAMTSLNQRTGLNQRTIDNARAEEGLDNQNFQNRMGLLGYVSGQDQQDFNQGIGAANMTLGQSGLGYQASSGVTNNQNNWNAANAAGQNAQNLAQWQQQINGNAQQQQAFGDAMGGFGAAVGSNPSAWNFGGGTQVPNYSPAAGLFSPNGSVVQPAANTPAYQPAPKVQPLFGGASR